jgi:hypothetical protein
MPRRRPRPGAFVMALTRGATAVQPGLPPQPGPRRLASLTRLRAAARRYHAAVPTPRATGRRPQGGHRRAAPPHQPYGPTSWAKSRAGGDGRVRRCQDTPRRGRWSVRGPQTPVQVFVAVMDGDERPWCLVTAALAWAGAQVVTACAARCRHGEGCRAQQQRLGREECRAGRRHLGCGPARCRWSPARGRGGGKAASIMSGARRVGGANPPGPVGHVGRPSASSAACSGGPVRSVHPSSSPWKTGRTSLSGLARTAHARRGLPKILETTA